MSNELEKEFIKKTLQDKDLLWYQDQLLCEGWGGLLECVEGLLHLAYKEGQKNKTD